MADIELSQSNADTLLQMAKVRASDEEYRYPGVGGNLIIPLTSEDKRENFLLDIGRGRIEIRRGKYQLRGHQVLILARLDFGGHHIATLMAKNCHALTFTFTARAMATNGLFRFRLAASTT